MNDLIRIPIGDGAILLPQHKVLRGLVESFGLSAGLGDVPRIGEYWSGQGGVNAGLMRGVNGQPDYWLIAATDDSGKFEDIAWGARGEEVPDAKCQFDGRVNTHALVSHGGCPAAEACAAVEIDGHSDFYLPARRELALCYANVPELFEKVWHWSSTQYSANHAWGQLFTNGGQLILYKLLEFRARAVRRVPI